MSDDQVLVQKEKVAFSVERRLLDQIRMGVLKPGDALPSERELKRDWGVGRATAREAMQSLERKGLIEIRHGEQAKVLEPSFERLISCLDEGMYHLLTYMPGAAQHMQEARNALEVSMARVAAQSRSDDDLEIMRTHLQAQRKNLHNPKGFEKAGHAFHAAIMATSGNPFLVAAGEAIMNWLSAHDLCQEEGRRNLNQAYEGHRAVYEAIEARDSERAGAAMADHLKDPVTMLSIARVN